jgi:metal-dependent amidase/aminoacylase/carboxypeptidase family protein
MWPTLQRVAGAERVELVPKVTGAEDFSFFQRILPGLFYVVGVTPPEVDPKDAYSNRLPRLFADERALVLDVRSLAHLALDWLEANA